MSRQEKSLKNKLVFRLFLLTFLVFLLVELIVVERGKETLEKSLDRALLARAEGLALITEAGPAGDIELDFADEVMRDFSGPRPRAYFVVLRVQDGSELERSASMRDFDFPLPKPIEKMSPRKPKFWDTRLAGKNVRCVALRTQARRDNADRDEPADEDAPAMGAGESSRYDCLFMVAMDRESLDDRFEDLVERTSIALGIGLLLLLPLVWIVVTRGFRPFDVMGREVQALSASNLVKVSVPNVKEIGLVARKLNHVIEHLQEAFERERRFSADVAHELRTPVSEMRTLAEVALRWKEGLDEENQKNYEDILESAKHMQEIITKLLVLCRCDAGAMQCRNEAVDILELLNRGWERFSREAARKNLAFRLEVPPDTTVNTDPELLATILDNLFSNAAAYSPTGGTVECRAGKDDAGFSLTVSNPVQGLSEEDVRHMFDRFWRKDKARETNDSHCGLGLSVVRSLARALELTISAELSAPTTLTMTLAGPSQDELSTADR